MLQDYLKLGQKSCSTSASSKIDQYLGAQFGQEKNSLKEFICSIQVHRPHEAQDSLLHFTSLTYVMFIFHGKNIRVNLSEISWMKNAASNGIRADLISSGAGSVSFCSLEATT